MKPAAAAPVRVPGAGKDHLLVIDLTAECPRRCLDPQGCLVAAMGLQGVVAFVFHEAQVDRRSLPVDAAAEHRTVHRA